MIEIIRPALVVALVLIGCTAPPEPAGQARPRSGAIRVAGEPKPLRAPHVAGDRLYGLTSGERGERLENGINAAFIAVLSPAAVPDPTAGSRVAYNAWEGQGPVLRLLDTGTGDDRILDRGAYSAAWRHDGAIAYFKGQAEIDLEGGERPIGHVVVRGSPDQRAVRWTEQTAQYVVAAWADDRLLVYRIGEGRWPDLLELEGPGKGRVVARDSALVAVSPDGDSAFLSTYGETPPFVQVVDIGERGRTARFSFGEGTPAEARGTRWIVESGSWVGDLVVAKASQGLIVFRIGPGSIEIDQVLRLDGTFPLGLFEPRLDRSGRRILAWAQLEELPRQPLPDTALVRCDRLTLVCVRGEPVSAGLGLRLVYNPSRP
jgi:hypothetical protein